VIDVDQHLYEPRGLWAEHIDPGSRDDALAIEDDELGHAWVTWRGGRLGAADVQVPGDTPAVGELMRRRRAGEPASYAYDEVLPDDFWQPAARLGRLDAMGVDEAVLFPNFGLLWERRLSVDLGALTANMGAWNRWCGIVAAEGGGRLHPVAHLTLRDPDWLLAQLAELDAAGVRLAMIAPAAVDGRPLSHPDHDRLWSAFVEHGVTPCFHVADQPRVLDDAFYPQEDESLVPVIESVFLWAPPAIALTDLIVNGALDRHPDLRLGIVELSAIWVPMYLLMLDGGWDFTTTLNGGPPAPLALRPSEYLFRQVRVASFSYEQPDRLARKSGDLYMACSDFPHSEGTATPVEDYERVGCRADDAPGLFGDNLRFLLGG
jgi:hypothetical protein